MNKFFQYCNLNVTMIHINKKIYKIENFKVFNIFLLNKYKMVHLNVNDYQKILDDIRRNKKIEKSSVNFLNDIVKRILYKYDNHSIKEFINYFLPGKLGDYSLKAINEDKESLIPVIVDTQITKLIEYVLSEILELASSENKNVTSFNIFTAIIKDNELSEFILNLSYDN